MTQERSTLPLFVVRDVVTADGSTFTATERLVALCIADSIRADRPAFPSLARIAEWTGLGVTAVRAAIARLCSGPEAVFCREPGGARPGARYESTRYTLAEGIATRAARGTRGSSGDAEGIATRARGHRHAYAERPIERPKERPISARSARGRRHAPVGAPSESAGTDNGNGAGKATARQRPGWVSRLGDALAKRREGIADYGRIGKALAPLVKEHGEAEVAARWGRYIDGSAYYGPHAFAVDFGRWAVDAALAAVGGRRPSPGETAMAEAEKFLRGGRA